MASCSRIGPRCDGAVVVRNTLFVVVVQGGVEIVPLAGNRSLCVWTSGSGERGMMVVLVRVVVVVVVFFLVLVGLFWVFLLGLVVVAVSLFVNYDQDLVSFALH